MAAGKHRFVSRDPSLLSVGLLRAGPAAALAAAGVGCVYLGIPRTQLVNEGPLVLGGTQPRHTPALDWAFGTHASARYYAGAAGLVAGGAIAKAIQAGAATREGKVLTLVGLAATGVSGCAALRPSPITKRAECVVGQSVGYCGMCFPTQCFPTQA